MWEQTQLFLQQITNFVLRAFPPVFVEHDPYGFIEDSFKSGLILGRTFQVLATLQLLGQVYSLLMGDWSLLLRL